MRRSTVTTDRLFTGVIGLGVLATGAAAVAWQLRLPPVPADSTLRIGNLDGIVGAGWWPYALGAAALLLIAVGLRWLYAHRPGQRVGATTLPTSSSDRELTVDVNTAAAAAAAALARAPHVASATGTTRLDRGERIVQLAVTLDSEPAALAAVTSAVDGVNSDLAHALDGVPFTSQVLLRAPRTATGHTRVA